MTSRTESVELKIENFQTETNENYNDLKVEIRGLHASVSGNNETTVAHIYSLNSKITGEQSKLGPFLFLKIYLKIF